MALAAISALLVPSSALAAQATVAWDATTDDTIAGYKLYIGPAGEGFPAPIDVGNVSSHAVTGLETGGAYHAAVSAYDIFAQEGELSAEVFFTPSDAPPDADADGLPDALEMAGCTSPTDDDSDDDGLADGAEDADRDGTRTGAETNPCAADSDDDGLPDGIELGATAALAGTVPEIFRADLDPTTLSDPLNPDTDGDGLADGAEDTNVNGRIDAGETDPLTPENPLLFADDFSDAGRRGDPSWRTARGRWSGTPQRDFISSGKRVDLALVAVPGGQDFSSGRIETRASFSKSFAKTRNAEIVFHFQDATHYRYLRLIPNGLVLGQVGQFSGEPGGVKARRWIGLLHRPWHWLRLDIVNGTLLKVYVEKGEIPAITYAFAAEGSGGVGLQTKYARCRFDDLAIWSDLVLR